MLYTVEKIDAEQDELYDGWKSRRDDFAQAMLKLNSDFLRAILGDDLYKKCIDPASFPARVVEQTNDTRPDLVPHSAAVKRVAPSDIVSNPKRTALERLTSGHNSGAGSAKSTRMRQAAKSKEYLSMIGQG